MLDHGHFPRNPDGSLVTRQACGGCGWRWGFHVCLAGKPDLFPKLLREPRKRAPRDPHSNRGGGSRSEEHIQALREASQRRWAKHHARNAERDAKIIAEYAEGQLGYLKIAEKFGISGDVCLRVLKQAQEDGVIVMRKPGTTIANGAI